MKIFSVVTFVMISIFIVTSCNKVDSNINSSQQLVKNEFTTMTGVFNSVNQIDLENILKDKNEAQASLILQPLSKKIISFIYSNYKIDISKSTDIAGIIIIGALIAKKEGVILIKVSEKGYGAAIDAGIRASSNEIIVIADADLSYDLLNSHIFVETLIENDLVTVLKNETTFEREGHYSNQIPYWNTGSFFSKSNMIKEIQKRYQLLNLSNFN